MDIIVKFLSQRGNLNVEWLYSLLKFTKFVNIRARIKTQSSSRTYIDIPHLMTYMFSHCSDLWPTPGTQTYDPIFFLYCSVCLVFRDSIFVYSMPCLYSTVMIADCIVQYWFYVLLYITALNVTAMQIKVKSLGWSILWPFLCCEYCNIHITYSSSVSNDLVILMEFGL